MRRRIPLIIVFVLIILASTSAQAKSNPPGQSPPSDVSLPTVTGVNAATQPLNGNSGTWSGPAPTYAYQWSRCNASGANCVSIAGATATIYMVASSDVGSTIRLVVVATNKNGATVAVSNPTPAITSLSQPATTSTSQSSTTSTTTTPTTTSTPTQTTPSTTTVATSTTVPTTTTFFTTTSTTTTTTTTTPSPVGKLFWSAGFESGDFREFGGVHTGLPTWGDSSATVVQQGSIVHGLNNDGLWVAAAPHTGNYAAALLVDGPATATGSAGGQRAELTSGYYDVPGTERWYGISVYIPSTPNRNASGGAIMYDNAVWETGWGTSLSLKTTDAVGDGGTPNSFEIANGAATSGQMNGWSSAYYRIAPIAYDQWVNFTIHVYWATDSTGYFEVYENGKLMTLTGDSVPSFSGTRVNGPNYGVSNQMVSEFDWYRGPSDLPSLLYLDNLKIGDTYSGVQPG